MIYDPVRSFAEAEVLADKWLTKHGMGDAIRAQLIWGIESAMRHGMQICDIALETLGREAIKRYIDSACTEAPH